MSFFGPGYKHCNNLSLDFFLKKEKLNINKIDLIIFFYQSEFILMVCRIMSKNITELKINFILINLKKYTTFQKYSGLMIFGITIFMNGKYL